MSGDDENQAAGSWDTVHHHVIPTERCGALNVWVQGDLAQAQNKDTRDSRCVFLTVHDVGENHNSWQRFANYPAMTEIKEKAIFIHVDLKGQEDGAEDIDSFPTMQEMGEDLVNVLDTLRVKVVIGLGEGAGANIMLRFGAMHVTRCLGIVCINPNQTRETATGIMEKIMASSKNFPSNFSFSILFCFSGRNQEDGNGIGQTVDGRPEADESEERRQVLGRVQPQERRHPDR